MRPSPAFCDYVTTEAAGVGLGFPWEIEFDDEDPPQDKAAQVVVVPELHLITLSFAADFGDLSRHDQRYYVAHELGHVIVWDLWQCVKHVERWMPAPEFGALEDRFEECEEEKVDHLAKLIAPRFRLPPRFALP